MITIKQSGITHIESIGQQQPGCISLARGTVCIDGIPVEIKQVARDILKTSNADYYASGALNNLLQEAIANWMQHKYDLAIKPTQIIPTHGCTGGLSLLMLALLHPKDEVIIPQPSYPIYEHLTHIARATPVAISYLATHSSNNWSWKLSTDMLESVRTKHTKMVILSNPMNPTGLVLDKQALKELVSWSAKHGIYLVLDEVYEDYLFAENFTSIASFMQESEWVIRVSSLSKSYAMSGWRIGHIIAPSKLVETLERTQHSLLICPSALGMWAGSYAYNHPELIVPYQKTIKENMLRVARYLAPLQKQGSLSYQMPSGGLNYFIKLDHQPMLNYCLSLIQEFGVSLVPGETFGETGNGFVRLCYARDPSVLEQGLHKLTAAWNQ